MQLKNSMYLNYQRNLSLKTTRAADGTAGAQDENAQMFPFLTPRVPSKALGQLGATLERSTGSEIVRRFPVRLRSPFARGFLQKGRGEGKHAVSRNVSNNYVSHKESCAHSIEQVLGEEQAQQSGLISQIKSSFEQLSKNKIKTSSEQFLHAQFAKSLKFKSLQTTITHIPKKIVSRSNLQTVYKNGNRSRLLQPAHDQSLPQSPTARREALEAELHRRPAAGEEQPSGLQLGDEQLSEYRLTEYFQGEPAGSKLPEERTNYQTLDEGSESPDELAGYEMRSNLRGPEPRDKPHQLARRGDLQQLERRGSQQVHYYRQPAQRPEEPPQAQPHQSRAELKLITLREQDVQLGATQ